MFDFVLNDYFFLFQIATLLAGNFPLSTKKSDRPSSALRTDLGKTSQENESPASWEK